MLSIIPISIQIHEWVINVFDTSTLFDHSKLTIITTCYSWIPNYKPFRTITNRLAIVWRFPGQFKCTEWRLIEDLVWYKMKDTVCIFNLCNSVRNFKSLNLKFTVKIENSKFQNNKPIVTANLTLQESLSAEASCGRPERGSWKELHFMASIIHNKLVARTLYIWCWMA